MKKIFIIVLSAFVSLLCFACETKTENKKQGSKVISSSDYNTYINADNKSLASAQKDNEFWSKRLTPDSSGVGDLGPLAGSYGALFTVTGDVNNLLIAEKLLKKAYNISATSKDGYARGLAQNYISQHRFKDAQQILEKTYAGPTNKRDTELQLFDVYMELGMYDKAFENLEKVKNTGDYHYLIRLAKWSDYRGDLDAAIKYLEQALEIAESGGLKPLKVWTYTNLGDFYGHAGRINDAYNMYLKTLKLDPDNAYAKKGIAWIAFAHENDTEEAKRIVKEIQKVHQSPDYYLLLAEIAEFEDDEVEMKKNLQLFEAEAQNPNYGVMYNAYFIEFYADSNPNKALEIAKKEIKNRATPETYQLLALAQLKNGLTKEALNTIETYVEGKTQEPMALLHSAMVYKANGLMNKVKPIKEELEGASFEIGPILAKKVKAL